MVMLKTSSGPGLLPLPAVLVVATYLAAQPTSTASSFTDTTGMVRAATGYDVSSTQWWGTLIKNGSCNGFTGAVNGITQCAAFDEVGLDGALRVANGGRLEVFSSSHSIAEGMSVELGGILRISLRISECSPP